MADMQKERIKEIIDAFPDEIDVLLWSESFSSKESSVWSDSLPQERLSRTRK
jgi:hypothetical protein